MDHKTRNGAIKALNRYSTHGFIYQLCATNKWGFGTPNSGNADDLRTGDVLHGPLGRVVPVKNVEYIEA